MTTTDDRVQELKLTPLDEMSGLGGWSRCPTCDTSQIPEGFDPSYEEIEKLKTWTLGQLIAFRALQRRSGIDYRALLARTSGGVMPGIGGALAGDVGTIGVNDLNGIFVGIEPDGYAHS